jgi:hypothetical protein
MKKIYLIFGIVFAIITACMIYLVKSGVGLRSAPLIRPTVMSPDHSNIAAHVVLRLFPELQEAHYIVWGVLPQTEDSQMLLTNFLKEYEKTFHMPARIILDAESVDTNEILNCAKPCWLLVNKDKANELSSNDFIEKKIQPLNQSYINITVVPFDNTEVVPEKCDSEKRVTADCITPLSVREVQKYLKKAPEQLHFFMRKYNEKDYFLFIQGPAQSMHK